MEEAVKELYRDSKHLIDGVMNSPVFLENDLRLYCHVRLRDLLPASDGLKGPNGDAVKGWCFSTLACCGTQVIFADNPVFIYDLDYDTDAFTFEGLSILTYESDEQWLEEARAILKEWHNHRPPAAWRYEPRPIRREDWPILAAKGLLDWEERFESACTPTSYGVAQGIARCLGRQKGYTLCCTVPAWLDIWDWGEDWPLWGTHGLDERLDCLKKGIMPDLGYYLAEVDRLMNMPMAVLLDGLPDSKELLEEQLSDCSLTYLELLRKIEEEKAEQPEDAWPKRWLDLAMGGCQSPFSHSYHYRMSQKETKRGRWGWGRSENG